MASNGQTLFGPGGDTNKIRSKLNLKTFLSTIAKKKNFKELLNL
jgi:hypothetical protein